MASPRRAPPKLVCRGGLPGQVALVASAALGQGPAAQAPRQSCWVGSAWRRGPEVGWCGVKDVYSEGHAVYLPMASRCVRVPERVVKEARWHAVGKSIRQGCSVRMVGRGRGRSPGTDLVLAAAVGAPWLGYSVPEAQKEANGEGSGGAFWHRR